MLIKIISTLLIISAFILGKAEAKDEWQWKGYEDTIGRNGDVLPHVALHRSSVYARRCSA